MKLLLCLFSIFIAISQTPQSNADTKVLSEHPKLDSLLLELTKAKGDTNEVQLLNNISSLLYTSNPNKGIEYGLRGVKLAKKIDWKVGQALCFNSLGTNFNSISNYPKALEYYHKALKINEQVGNKSDIAKNFGNIGNVYNSLLNYKQALIYYEKALKIIKQFGSKSSIANYLGNIGIVYSKQKKYSEALEYYKKALKINEQIANKPSIANNLGNIGIIYEEQSDFLSALEYYKKALKINRQFGSKRGVAFNFLNVGLLYLKISQKNSRNDLPEASLANEISLNHSIDYLLIAERLFTEINYLNELSVTFKSLHTAYELKGEFKKSLKYIKMHVELQDSIFSKKNSDIIDALNKSRTNELKQKEIEKQKIRLIEQEKREQIILYFSIVIVFLMTIVMISIYRLLKRSDKLLYNVLPVSIAKRLKNKEHPISDYFVQASIVFIDIVNFTERARDIDPIKLVEDLNMIFSKIDIISDKFGLEKIKTIGDSYMAAAGIPEVQKNNAQRAAQMALEVREMMKEYKTTDGTNIEVRIGLDCGPVVAGVIGENKFIYDMWSDAVNTASRMESTSIAGEVHVTERFKVAVTEFEEFDYIERGEIEIKGKGKIKTYFMVEVKQK